MIVTLTGPSCGGKSTLERALQALGFGRAISHTTREARSGEVCGEHYHFVIAELQARYERMVMVDRRAESASFLSLAKQMGG